MHHFNCDTCEFSCKITRRPREYVLADGRTLRINQRHIWCSTCQSVTVAEALNEDPVRRQNRVALLASHRAELQENTFPQGPDRELRKKWIAELVEFELTLAAWQKMRVRSERCLKCGNENIVVPETDGNLPHPPCGGTLELSFTVTSSTARIEPHKYTPEGELISLGYYKPLADGGDPKPLPLW